MLKGVKLPFVNVNKINVIIIINNFIAFFIFIYYLIYKNNIK